MENKKTRYEVLFDPARKLLMLPAVRYSFVSILNGGK